MQVSRVTKYLKVGSMAVGAAVSLMDAQTQTINVHADLVLNPTFTISEAHPTSWNPQVGDMTLMPDGRLVVLTHEMNVNDGENTTNVVRPNGKLYIVSGVNGGDTSKIVPTLVATDLKEPTGVAVVDGKIYVEEKLQLTEFTLGAPGAMATARKVTDIPVDPSGQVNFQEYAFGLIHKDGYLYTAAGGGVKIGGISWVDDLSKLTEPLKDGILKIKIADGTKELLNGGLRAPNGIAFGPNGTLWVTDNQGSFLPSCKLINVVAGRNYGYVNGPGKYRDMAETPPTVWFPYAEIGRSLTHPTYLKKGVFAGQFLMGDICQGGMIRAAVELVNGEYQGSAHSFSGGFSAGVEVNIEQDDGSILVGNLGRGDLANWGWRAKVRGLQKITPKPGAMNFEMLALHAKKEGIEIEFTQPVMAGADVASMYTMFYGTMKPGPKYGEGNMQVKTVMAVKGVKVSEDKKRVLLETDGMVAGTVVAVKVAGLKSATADTLYRPAAWYTLNTLSTISWSGTSIAINDRAKARGYSLESIVTRRMGRNLSVTVPFEGGHELTLRNLRGRALETRTGAGPAQYQLGASGLVSGVYLLDLKVGDQLLRKSVVF